MATAPVDRRRNVGPEISVRPISAVKGPTDATRLLTEEYVRQDGRFPEQLRPFVVRTGPVTRASGSAYVEAGNTKVVCSVYGPRSAAAVTGRTTGKAYQLQGNVSCEINYVPFSTLQRCPHQPEAEEMDMATLLLQAVCPAIRRELFPNAFVDIYVTVLERDGNALAAAINAASIALAQAGVEMLDLVLASSAALVEPGVFLMDPAQKEVEHSSAHFTLAFLPSLNQITQLHLTGTCQPDLLTEAIALGVDGVRALYEDAMRPALEALL